LLRTRPPPRSTLFPYTTLFRSLKTGYTKNAKFCLVATAQKDNHRLIAIALGVSNPWLRNQIVGEMLNNYYVQLGCGPMGNEKIRSEEHTSELQSREKLVCRLLL